MGDLSTHAKVAWQLASKLRTAQPGAAFLYLELGSFLTDVSQFNDPYAFLSNKRQVLETRGALAGAIVAPYLDNLLGRPAEAGQMALFLRLVARAVARIVFCDFEQFLQGVHRAVKNSYQQDPIGIQNHIKRLTEQLKDSGAGGAPKDLLENAGDLGEMAAVFRNRRIDSAELETIFDRMYTQYFPHEHMDMPPFELPPSIDKLDYRPYPSGLATYLEDYVQFLAEEFGRLEEKWLAVSDLSSAAGKDLLVHTGHLLHAVEDFYFHSNFSELQYSHFSSKGLASRSDERKRVRRTRFPRFTSANFVSRNSDDDSMKRRGDFFPSESGSEDAKAFLYTGFFGREDMSHSVGDALHGLRGFLISMVGESYVRVLAQTRGQPVLLRLLIDDTYRSSVALGSPKSLLDMHRREITFWEGGNLSFEGSLWDQTLERWEQNSFISAACRADLTAAFRVDVALIANNSVVATSSDIGVGAAIITLLLDAEREVQLSNRRSRALEGATDAPLLATYNGASEETIGTHSLMSKDSKRKRPFREEAFAVALHASTAIANRLLSRAGDASNPDLRVDWIAVLGQFLRFPSDKKIEWENLAVAKNISSTATSPWSGNPLDFWIDSTVAKRRIGTAAVRLEKRYKALEAPAEAGALPRWRDPLARPAHARSTSVGPSIRPLRPPTIQDIQ